MPANDFAHERVGESEDPPGRVQLDGIYIDRCSMSDAVKVILQMVARRRGGLVITPNVSIARQMRSERFNSYRRRASLWLLDGTPLKWLLRLHGFGHFERVTGADLLKETAAAAARANTAVTIIGSSGTVAVNLLRERCKDARFYGGDLPYTEIGDPRLLEVAVRLLPSEPSAVFVCLGFPKQEYLATKLLDLRPDCVYIGAGASADMLVGHVTRSPQSLQRVGLEWLWRLILEPRRLTRRYLLEDLPWLVRELSKASSAAVVRTLRDCRKARHSATAHAVGNRYPNIEANRHE